MRQNYLSVFRFQQQGNLILSRMLIFIENLTLTKFEMIMKKVKENRQKKLEKKILVNTFSQINLE